MHFPHVQYLLFTNAYIQSAQSRRFPCPFASIAPRVKRLQILEDHMSKSVIAATLSGRQSMPFWLKGCCRRVSKCRVDSETMESQTTQPTSIIPTCRYCCTEKRQVETFSCSSTVHHNGSWPEGTGISRKPAPSLAG
jgi:hypothetical protein